MKLRRLHRWDLSPKEAVTLQRKLACRVDASSPLQKCDLVAGADVSYARFSPVLHAGVVVFRLSDGAVVEEWTVVQRVTFPYVPGLLSFREGPPLLKAFAQLRCEPDLIMLDGQGLAHPRRFGLACHLGLWLDRPTLGCAKSRFVGEHDEPGPEAGATAALVDRGEVVGRVLRTKRGTNPVFVSVGHRLDLASAVFWTVCACRGYRIPEPVRLAHLLVNRSRAESRLPKPPPRRRR